MIRACSRQAENEYRRRRKELVEKQRGSLDPGEAICPVDPRPKGTDVPLRRRRLGANHPALAAASLSVVRCGSPGCSTEAIFEELFERNGWADSWRNGVYDYLHFHSRIHEVMGVARGSAVVQFGGRRGRRLRLKAGDVVILPAGTGHRSVSASKNFLVVGAYPGSAHMTFAAPRRPSTIAP